MTIKEEEKIRKFLYYRKRREELITATKEYQKSLNVYNKSDYLNNKEFKGRYENI